MLQGTAPVTVENLAEGAHTLLVRNKSGLVRQTVQIAADVYQRANLIATQVAAEKKVTLVIDSSAVNEEEIGRKSRSRSFMLVGIGAIVGLTLGWATASTSAGIATSVSPSSYGERTRRIAGLCRRMSVPRPTRVGRNGTRMPAARRPSLASSAS